MGIKLTHVCKNGPIGRWNIEKPPQIHFKLTFHKPQSPQFLFDATIILKLYT